MERHAPKKRLPNNANTNDKRLEVCRMNNEQYNKWALEIYKDLGHKGIIAIDPKIDETISMNSVGDTMIEVRYPKIMIKKIKKFFEKYSSVQEMSMKEITTIAHEKCEIKFIVYRNREISNTFNEKFLKYFKK